MTTIDESSRVALVLDDSKLGDQSAKRRENCGACGSADLEPFLNLGSTPLADSFPEGSFPTGSVEDERYYPLEVAVCRSCWLVQLLDVVPSGLLFGEDYGFYSSSSPSLRDYHTTYAGRLLAEFRDRAKRLTVEVACNDGDLLNRFKVAGCRVVGVDPARNVAEEAKKRDLSVLPIAFGRDAAKRILESDGRAGLVIANHVVAHVDDLDDLVGGFRTLLADDGILSIEVQYAGDLLTGNQFDHVYHEHRSFFALGPLAAVLERYGLPPRRVRHTPQQGGSIQVLAGGLPDDGSVPQVLRSEAWLRDPAPYRSMQGRVDHVRDRLLDLLAKEKRTGHEVAGYAASAKSTTLLNYCGIDRNLLNYVVDTTPHKIGRFTPGTHIPIAAPGYFADPDTFLLLAWNYLPGVLKRERAFTDAGGKFLVPIPLPVLL
jgi:novobiocin biosynthesis protein NovU/D-mycarose 3-C-methyltransferase